MSKYLKLFETTSQYNEYITSIDVVLPNVSVAKDAPSTVYFNPLLPHDYSEDYLTLSALGSGTIILSPNRVDSSTAKSISWSKDKDNWNTITIGSNNSSIQIPVVTGDTIYLKGSATTWWNWDTYPESGLQINSDCDMIAEGNIMSLLYEDDFKDKISFPDGSSTFRGLFRDNGHLINAENLILPATTLAQRCYRDMFYNCTALTTAPALPATTLGIACYNGMFNGCSSLITAPTLHATTLANYCYDSMFSGCSSLTAAPELPATTLADYCYTGMFSSCSSLNNITMLATDISAWRCLENWVDGVASTGTFVKNSAATWNVTGVNGIPNGWTITTASA